MRATRALCLVYSTLSTGCQEPGSPTPPSEHYRFSLAGPPPSLARIQHLCLDKGYDNPPGHGDSRVPGTRPAHRGGETGLSECEAPSGAAVGCGAHLGLLSKCRAILVRYDKRVSNYIGLIQLACALFWYRRQWQLKC